MTDFNPKRIARLQQLTTDTHSILKDGRDAYAAFLIANQELNTKIAAVYAKANLSPPTLSDQDVLSGTNIGKTVAEDQQRVKVATVVIDMVGTTAMIEMAPAATLYLLDAGLLTEEVAGTAIASMFGFELTVGTAVGGVIGLVVVGIVGGAITAGVSALSHHADVIKLRGGIASMKQMRLQACLSREKLQTVVQVMEDCKVACDEISEFIGLDDMSIQNLIRSKAKPSLKKLASINRNTAIAELYQLDINCKAWMQDG